MATKTIIILSLSLIIFFNVFFSTSLFKHYDNDDLSFIEEVDGHDSYQPPPPPWPIDDNDVVVLRESNFSDFVEKNRHVMVLFYAPWCYFCKALAPEYAAAATELKEEAVLAKVDATEELGLAHKYKIQGYPTMFLFIGGVHKPYYGDYYGHRKKDAIATWVRKKMCPTIENVTTIEEAEHILSILTAGSKIVLGFLDTLEGPESKELACASGLEDDVNFYQTASPDVAKLFHISPQSKRPALVLVTKVAEKISHFNSQFTKSGIAEFVSENKIPPVTIFTRESAPLIVENPIKKQNEGDVKVVVVNDFDEIVLDESKDVLLEIYAPWCGHCQSLEPIYNELAKHVSGIDSLVIAKMDGTTNEHPRAKADGFPTLLFFPAGNKSFDPITVDTDRTVVAFYEFLKNHAVAFTTKHTQENNMLQAALTH
ncbi:protein disulfide isomerase-like 1-4 [Cornus florida]|uniref:protein disulfide isomerase-like 1-4 n=1 Tax=Cornus florida TaxID=4283 RepID=UPI0028A2568D|nr:protein disulfide isomerase-like 1-4 [Cornus florida]